jgi:hypothetical protein
MTSRTRPPAPATLWALIKEGRVKTVSIGRRRLVIYSLFESLLISDHKAVS